MASPPQNEGWFFPRSYNPSGRGAHTCHYAVVKPSGSTYSLCGEWPFISSSPPRGDFFRKEMVKIPPPFETGPRCRKCLRKLEREEKNHT